MARAAQQLGETEQTEGDWEIMHKSTGIIAMEYDTSLGRQGKLQLGGEVLDRAKPGMIRAE